MLKRREECNTYLTHVCRHCWSGENNLVNRQNIEFSANTVAFISCRCRLMSTRDESHSVGWKFYIVPFHQVLSRDVHRCESGRCCTLPFFLTFFIITPIFVTFLIRTLFCNSRSVGLCFEYQFPQQIITINKQL